MPGRLGTELLGAQLNVGPRVKDKEEEAKFLHIQAETGVRCNTPGCGVGVAKFVEATCTEECKGKVGEL